MNDHASEASFIWELRAIRGVKSAYLYPADAYVVVVVVRYSLWTYLIPFAQRRAAKRVHDFVYGSRAYGVSMSVKGEDPI